MPEPRAPLQPRPPRQRGARAGARSPGSASRVPETVVANAPIADRLGIDEDWIVQRTGIGERRIAAPGERLSDLAAAAGERALAAAGDRRRRARPGPRRDDQQRRADARRRAAGRRRARRRRAGAIDLNAACTGFVSGLSLACGQIESGRAGNVLVVGADLMSRVTDPDDRAHRGRLRRRRRRDRHAGRRARAGSARSCSAPTAPTPT